LGEVPHAQERGGGCDGTANEFARNRTNVVKLFFTLAADPATQVALLSSRPRHDGAAGALTPLAQRVTRLAGLAFGYAASAWMCATPTCSS